MGIMDGFGMANAASSPAAEAGGIGDVLSWLGKNVSFGVQGEHFGVGVGQGYGNTQNEANTKNDQMFAALLQKLLADDEKASSAPTDKVTQPVSPINQPITPIQPMRVGPTLPPPGMSPYGGGMVGNWMGNLTGGPLRP